MEIEIFVGSALVVAFSENSLTTNLVLVLVLAIGWLGKGSYLVWRLNSIKVYERHIHQSEQEKRTALAKQKPTAADLEPGKTYQVISTFKDYDGIIHPIGESWRFVKKSFLPYEDGLTLFVEKDGQEVWIRLQWRPEMQGQLIDNFHEFVEQV